MSRLMTVFFGIVGLALIVSSEGAIAATECNTGAPPAATPLTGTINGGLVVNGGDFCLLVGATVNGGVRVNSGGTLVACASTINGGFVSDHAAGLIFGAEEAGCDGDVINGGVRISNSGATGAFPGAPSIAVENSRINGGVYLTGNQGPIAVAFNTIKGGLFCSNNVFELDDEDNPSVISGPIRCTFGD